MKRLFLVVLSVIIVMMFLSGCASDEISSEVVYMPHLYVIAPDWAGAVLTKWEGDQRTYIKDAEVILNGVPLGTFSDDYYYYPQDKSLLNLSPGTTAAFKISYPGMEDIYEAIIVPHPATNLTAANVTEWVNKQADLTINWDAPGTDDYQYWWLEVKVYDSMTGDSERYQSNWGDADFPYLNMTDRSYTIPYTILTDTTGKVEIRIVSTAERRLGSYRANGENYGYYISADVDSEPVIINITQ